MRHLSRERTYSAAVKSMDSFKSARESIKTFHVTAHLFSSSEGNPDSERAELSGAVALGQVQTDATDPMIHDADTAGSAVAFISHAAAPEGRPRQDASSTKKNKKLLHTPLPADRGSKLFLDPITPPVLGPTPL